MSNEEEIYSEDTKEETVQKLRKYYQMKSML